MTATSPLVLSSTANPYVGPRTFVKEQAERFFGRQSEARELLAVVTAERLTLFYAQSGAGKSSLINTRLIPGLEMQGFEVLPVGRVSGGDDARQAANPYSYNLMRSLVQHDVDPTHFATLTLRDFLAQLVYLDDGYVLVTEAGDGVVQTNDGDDEQGTGIEAAPSTHNALPAIIPRVLIIDQFEELLTTYPSSWQQRSDFFDQLSAAMADDPYLWVVLALRADYVAGLDPYAHCLPNGLRARYFMQRMGARAALEAVQKPAAEIGHRPFAAGVAEELVTNLRQVQSSWASNEHAKPTEGEFVEPVQLQVVCYQLWEQLQQRSDAAGPYSAITAADLKAQAGARGLADFVNQALADYYEQAIRRVLQHPAIGVNERDLRDWFSTKLIMPGGTRGLVYQGHEPTGLSGLPDTAVRLFEDQFLVRAEVRGNDRWYELVHDRFVQPILEANRNWLLKQHNPVSNAHRLWLDDNRNWKRLLQGVQLADAQRYAAHNPGSLNDWEREFLRESAKAQKRKTVVACVVVALALVMCIGMLYIFSLKQEAKQQAQNAQQQAQNAQQQARRAKAGELAFAAQSQMTRPVLPNPSLALLLAIQAVKMIQSQNDPVLVNATNVLDASVRAAPPWRATLTGHQAAVTAAAYSPDGQYIVTTSFDTTARVWEAASGQEKLQLTGHQAAVTAAAYSPPDGRYIVTTSDDTTARVWDAATGKLQHTLTGHQAAVTAAAYSPPDGRYIVTTSFDKTARIWDATTGREQRELIGHEAGVTSAAYSPPDGRYIVTASSDKTARIWDTTTGQEQRKLTGHGARVLSAAYSLPDGQYIVTASEDGTVRVWDAASGQEQRTLTGFPTWIASVAYNPKGHYIITANADRTARIWDSISAQEQLRLTGHEAVVTSAVYSPNGQYIVTTSDDKTARIWDVPSCQERCQLTGHTSWVSKAAYSPKDHYIVTASNDTTARIWDATTGRTQHTLIGHKATVTSAAYSPDGQYIVTTSDDTTARIWDAATGRTQHTLIGHEAAVTSAAYSLPDGQYIVTASGDGTARIWDATTGQEQRKLIGHENWITSAAYSPDGLYIVTASNDKTARIWDATTGQEQRKLIGHEKAVTSAAYSLPDGQYIVTTSFDTTARIWDAATGRTQHILIGHEAVVTSAAYSPDGQYIVTASEDGTVRIWNAATGQEQHILIGHEAVVTSVAYSSDGQYIVTTSFDATARIWRTKALTLDELVRRACSLVQRQSKGFTPEERAKYEIDDIAPCPSTNIGINK